MKFIGGAFLHSSRGGGLFRLPGIPPETSRQEAA
jgi:hypothetical protein